MCSGRRSGNDGLGRVGTQHVAGTRWRFDRQAGGERSQYVDIGKIDDELAGQNDRALKGLVEIAIWCVEALADIEISASTFSCQLNHFVPNPGSRDECQHAQNRMTTAQWLTSAIAGLAMLGVILRPFRLPEACFAVSGALLLVLIGCLSRAGRSPPWRRARTCISS